MLLRVWWLFVVAVLIGSPLLANEPEAFEAVRVILERRCLACHSTDESKGGLVLETRDDVLRGGEGGPSLDLENPAASLLVEMIAGDAPAMPKGQPPLAADEVAAIRRWIASGAAWPVGVQLVDRRFEGTRWWSWEPIRKVEIPVVDAADRDWVRTPIDSFILSSLRSQGLSPSGEADRRTLIRRLSFDLCGLPPTPADVESFVNDESPDAYERLVDRLLASPRYGERWARHWLDVVHFGETHGYDKDKPRLQAWPYRDYVIRSFNEDKPYAQFVMEQVAGDVLYPGTADGIEALGMISAGPWDYIGHAEVPETKIDGKLARHLDRDDMVGNVIGTFNSLTIQCAQCHAHKFDPISQHDYYRLHAVFAALDRADKRFDLDPAVAKQREMLGEQQRQLEARQRTLTEPVEKQAVADALAEIATALGKLPPPRIVYAATVHHGTGSFRGTGPDGGRPRAIHLLHRGDVKQPREVVDPGAIGSLTPLDGVFPLAPEHREGDRRAALARWLVDPRHPLTWRSIVNRVWLYHFGRGLVATPDDFGRNGERPTHPELLDWLAGEFRDSGGSIKQLHRRMVTSAVYLQRSDSRGESTLGIDPTTVDAGNVWLWRMQRRRLEAEAIRDSMLAVAGRLDGTLGGPSFQDFVIEQPAHSPHYEYDRFDPTDPRGYRRSIYRFLVRSQPQPFMSALDCADPSMRVDRRNESVSALQALALLNNGFTLAMAREFAARLERASNDPAERIDRAVRLALGREPQPAERAALGGYVAEHGLENLARLLFNLNEFVFVD